jgi:hypothetical protein
MKHEAKQYHFFKRKADNKVVGKVVEIKAIKEAKKE